jgi:trk system potassium uptake protein TrkA
MKIIIMGCGRVGEHVSRLMDAEGHAVTVIDCDGKALGRLGPQFKGQAVLGVGFERETLVKAGIEQADAFAATSSSDDVNIVAARLARNVFHVPRVVARLYDPRRAEIYQRLGLVTISPTLWGAERIREMFSHASLDAVATFGSGEVSLIVVEAPVALVGRTVNTVTVPGEITPVAITRDGRAFLPTLGTEISYGDTLHLAVMAEGMDRLESLLGLGEGGY